MNQYKDSLDNIIYQDSFTELTESSTFKYTDFSELKYETFNEDKAFDFISKKENITKSWNGNNSVLGVFEGIFFMPDGISGNKRFYSKELWDKALKNPMTIKSLESGMLGTYEHPVNYSLGSSGYENNLGMHTTSHPRYAGILTKELSYKNINGQLVGWGKSYIMNTPIGNIINVMLKAKDENGNPLTKLAVSSRSKGLPKWKVKPKKINGLTIEGEPLTDSQGNIIIDPDNFILITFDVVTNPGFKEATPKYRPIYESLVESLINCDCEDNCRKEYINLLGLESFND